MDVSETYGTNTIAGYEMNGMVNNQSLDIVLDEGRVFFIGVILGEPPVESLDVDVRSALILVSGNPSIVKKANNFLISISDFIRGGFVRGIEQKRITNNSDLALLVPIWRITLGVGTHLGELRRARSPPVSTSLAFEFGQFDSCYSFNLIYRHNIRLYRHTYKSLSDAKTFAHIYIPYGRATTSPAIEMKTIKKF